MTNPLDAINDLVNKATQAPSQLRWLMCRECGNVLEHDMSTIPPADPCAGCGAPFNRVTFPSKELAEQKRRELRKEKNLPLSPADLVAIQRDAAAPTPAAPVAAPTHAAPASVVPTPAPVVPEKVEPATEAPKPKRGRASKGTETSKSTEAAKVPEIDRPEPQTASAPILAPMPEAPADLFPTEATGMTPEQWNAKRDADKVAFISKLALSHTAWTPCGHGRLFTTGFWDTRDDGTRFIDWCEIHDTPASFASRYNEAKMRDSKTTADQGMINDLSADLKLVAFRGTINASLRQVLQSCSIRPTYGCRVSLAAKLTESGNISFQVTAVSK